MEIPFTKHKGKIRTVELRKESPSGLAVGGQDCLALHLFEGSYPNKPVIAWEITDTDPSKWLGDVRKPYEDVLGDPVGWAKMVREEHGAKIICLNLIGTDPNKDDKSPEEAASLLKNILSAIDIPVIVKGPGPGEKQNDVLSACAEAASGQSCLFAGAVEEHYKTLVASCMAYNHVLVAESPIDVNLCKQLNILISDMNFPLDRIAIDPLTGGLGYGLEYTYSVMERIRLQALGGDEMMQNPFICFIGDEVWKVKEVKADDPAWGDREKRAILWEIATATSLLYSGADILVMRHPEAIKAVNEAIDDLMKG